MFTVDDICQIAIQIERNGEASYRRASQTVSDPDSARLLFWMAEQEQRHAQWFEKMAPRQTKSLDNQQLIDMGRELLLGMVEHQTFSLDADIIAENVSFQDLLLRSIEFENDTILFYEMLSGFIDEPEVIKQLDAIIAEERIHVETIQNMVNVPEK